MAIFFITLQRAAFRRVVGCTDKFLPTDGADHLGLLLALGMPLLALPHFSLSF